MKKKLYSLLLLAVGMVEAETLEKALENTTIDGYLRGTYHLHDIDGDKTYVDDAIGGKLHIETPRFRGLSVGASFYTSHTLGDDDNRGLVPLRGESSSYSILGEAYLNALYGNSMLKIGRQEIETPFIQRDDIGMIPNTFEAIVLLNKDIKDTTITLAQVEKMAGVDAEVVDKFSPVNGDKNIQTLGVTYEGLKNLVLSGWYYNIEDGEIDKITYLEANYETSSNGMGYGLGLQYAKQGYSEGQTAKVMSATLSSTFESMGLTLATAYTKTKDNASTSGFGGGPFFSNSEYLTIDSAGKDGKALWYGCEWDANEVGLKGISLALGKIVLENEAKKKSTEVDFVASYEFNDNLEFHLIASDLKGKNVEEDEAKHLRAFVNYNF